MLDVSCYSVEIIISVESAEINRLGQNYESLLFRERERRKNQIRDFISRSFNWDGQPMPTGEEVRERISSLPEVELPVTTTTIAPDPLTMHYTERVQSFFPICKIN